MRIIKFIIITFSLLILHIAVYAVPAKPGLWTTITLVDGQQVRVQLAGDEHMHFYVSETGQRFVKDPQSEYYIEASAEQVSEQYARRKAKRSQKRKLLGQIDKASFQGSQKGLIILVEFPDMTFAEGHAPALYERIANEENFTHEMGFNGSVHDYFRDQSHGAFDLTFDVVGPVMLEHEHYYYGENDSRGNDMRPGEMVAEAVLAVQEEVDFSKYDWNGDGVMENFYVLYAGLGEADSNDHEAVWPHMWYLSSSDYGQTIQLNGVTIDIYACGNERLRMGKIEGIGTLCHEFSHCMGFPDMYDTAYTGNFGMGKWDLMSSGSYLNGSFTPAGYSAYERWQCGWLEPIELVNDTTITDMKAVDEVDAEAFIIYNKGHRDEYYILENRQLTGWNKYLPAAGMLITHVDYDPELWQYNAVNTTGYIEELGRSNDHQRLTIFHADDDDDANYFSSWSGGYWMKTEEGDAYPYSEGLLCNDSLTNNSTPAAMVYNENTDGSLFMNIAINNITQNDDGTIAFYFGDSNITPGPGPEPLPEGTLFYESFNKCQGKGGNDDGGFSGSVATGDFIPDITGWENVGGAMYGAYQCARFGTTREVGVVTTPKFGIEGETTLSFKAAPWGNDDTTLLLSIENLPDDNGAISNVAAIISPAEITMTKGEWTDFTVTIQGEGSVRVTFSPAKRFFLDEVIAVKKESAPSGISHISYTSSFTSYYYTLDGQRLSGKPTQKGIYIFSGKKVVVK